MSERTFPEQVWDLLEVDQRAFFRHMQELLPEDTGPAHTEIAILDGEGRVWKCDMVTHWVWQMAMPNMHRIDLTKVGEAEVSTVFCPIATKNKHFETMILGPRERRWTYKTLAQAKAGHQEIVVALNNHRGNWLEDHFMEKLECPQCKHSHTPAALLSHMIERHGVRTAEALRQIDRMLK